MAEKASENILDNKDVSYAYIPMVLDGVEDYQYNENLFSDGIDVGSYLAGIATALRNMNSEIDKDDIVEILKLIIEKDYGLGE